MASLTPTEVAVNAVRAVLLDLDDLGHDELADWIVDALREADYIERGRQRYAAMHVRQAFRWDGNGLVAPEHFAAVAVETLRREGYLTPPPVTIEGM